MPRSVDLPTLTGVSACYYCGV